MKRGNQEICGDWWQRRPCRRCILRPVGLHLKWIQWGWLGWLMTSALAPAVPNPNLYGVVETTQGQRLVGYIEAVSGSFLVIGEHQTNRIGIGQLASLRFQTPPPPPLPDHGLRGSYFNTQNLKGNALDRVDPAIAFNWGDQAPMDKINRDNFSVRWQGSLEAPVSGSYVFHTETDDGIRLWIGGKQLIDQWKNQSVAEAKGAIHLEAGKRYDLKMEYFEASGQAVARLLWTVPGQPRATVPADALFPLPARKEPDAHPEPPVTAHGLLGLYFLNTNLAGRALAVTNPTINFNWGQRPPMNRLPPDRFSVRWLGRLRPPKSGLYVFHAQSDDGVRLWLEDDLLIDRWQDGLFNAHSQPLLLAAGKDYRLRMEMYDHRLQAKAQLFWTGPNISRSIIPSQYLIPEAAQTGRQATSQSQAGVLMRDGTFVAQSVYSADDATIRFSNNRTAPTLATVHVAEIRFQSVPPHWMSRLEPGRTGVLLKTGDFVDGEFQEYKSGRIRLNSVLLGLKVLRRDQALVLVLHEPISNPARFEVRTRNGSRFFVNALALENQALQFGDPALEGWQVAVRDVTGVERRSPDQ